MRLLILAALAIAPAMAADTVQVSQPLPALRGDTIILKGNGFTAGATVDLTLTQSPADPVAVTGLATSTDAISFVVPHALAFGRWKVEVAAGGAAGAAVSPSRSIEVKAKPPKIDSVAPKVLYLGQGHDSVTVIGSDLSEEPSEYRLNFLDSKSLPPCDDAIKIDCYQTSSPVPGYQLTFKFKWTAKSPLLADLGTKRFNVVVDGATSNPMDVTFSAVDENTPRIVALAVVAVAMILVYLLLRAGKKNIEHKVMGAGDDRTYFLSALFLDKETNTYSLSQCQFYLWTLAGLLGYVYLATSKSLVQGSPAFPDIPAGLPGILLASAGTTVLAAGITSAKGNKGSGEIHPSLSDFITSGGVVAAERLQFVVWTLAGVVTFVRLVLWSDPATIDTLPEIPSNFLQMMGISSAGYLGGKLVRKAGPNVASVTAASSPGALCLELNGQGLSPSGAFSIDDDLVAPEQINGQDAVKILAKDNATDGGFASKLAVRIANPKPEWVTAVAHRITISNPDGQKAVGSYQVTPAPAAAVTSATLTVADGRLTVIGSGLKDAKVALTDATGKALTFTADPSTNPADDKIVGIVAGASAGVVIQTTVTPPCGAPVTRAVTPS